MPIDFRASQIQTNKLIASGSTGTETGAQLVVYSYSANDGTAPNQGFIDQSVFVTSSIGTDIFLYVSGGIGERNVGGAQSISVFGGDVYVSGNMAIENGFSASLQQLPSGIPYLLAGPNVTITTNSLGQVEVSSSGGGGGGGGGSSFYRLEVLDYYATNNTSDTTAGQVIFPANQFTGSLVLHGVIANSDSTATGSVRLYNVSSGSYVHIGGVGNTYLSVSGTSPTIVTSVDLISASNFNSSSQAIYELQVSSSNGGSTAFFGGFELRPSGSFTGISYITSSVYNNYISGNWEDGSNRLATTSSVAIAGNLGTGYFADSVGADVYFFVSGNNGGVGAGNGVSVFGGDVVISGVLYGGSPLKIGGAVQQGQSTVASGDYSHAEGTTNTASGYGSHAEGGGTTAFGAVSHAEGADTYAFGDRSHAEGQYTTSRGIGSHAEGYITTGSGDYSHAEGYQTLASGSYSHAEGNNTNASGSYCHAEGQLTVALGQYSHAEGRSTIARGVNSHAEGQGTITSGSYSHAEGQNSIARGQYSHAEGLSTLASDDYSHSEGYQSNATGLGSHSEGYFTTAAGFASHAEGESTYAGADSSHAEGYATSVSNAAFYGHAEGRQTIVSASYGHAEGRQTIVVGSYSHAEGYGTIASGSYQHVQGKFNKRGNNFSLFVVGDGTADADANRGDIVRINAGAAIGVGVAEITGSFSVSGTQSTFHQYTGLRYYPKIVTSLPYTASLNDYIIAVSASAGLGIELPSSEFGRTFIVKDVSGSATTDNVTITAAGGELIDGSPNATIGIDYGSLKFVYFGSAIGWGVV